MNAEKFEQLVNEVYQNMEYLTSCIEHLKKMFCIASNCYYNNDEVHFLTDCNIQALADVEQFAKKVSSRADILQNKINEYSKLVK